MNIRLSDVTAQESMQETAFLVLGRMCRFFGLMFKVHWPSESREFTILLLCVQSYCSWQQL